MLLFMKIAIDARIIRSGTGRYIERLLNYLEKIDHENEYLILVRKADVGYYKPRNKNFKIVEADFKNYSFGEQLGFARLLNSLKPDLVHFCMPQQPLLYGGAAVTSILDLNLLRITSNDDMSRAELRIKKIIFAGLLKRVARRSRHIITISNYSKQDIINFTHVPPEKITVAYPAADKLAGGPEPISSLKNKKFILYVGRAEPYKNNRGLMKMHQQLLTDFPDLQLVIAGAKDVLRQADEKWASEQGFKNITFIGFIPDSQLAWLYSNCEAYVFPSFMEGFGLPGLEAMVYGAPVAAANISCIPEILGDAAIYFDPANIQNMAETVKKIITNQKLRSEIIAKGHAQVGKYSWQRMAEQVHDVYLTALSQNPKETD